MTPTPGFDKNRKLLGKWFFVLILWLPPILFLPSEEPHKSDVSFSRYATSPLWEIIYFGHIQLQRFVIEDITVTDNDVQIHREISKDWIVWMCYTLPLLFLTAYILKEKR